VSIPTECVTLCWLGRSSGPEDPVQPLRYPVTAPPSTCCWSRLLALAGRGLSPCIAIARRAYFLYWQVARSSVPGCRLRPTVTRIRPGPIPVRRPRSCALVSGQPRRVSDTFFSRNLPLFSQEFKYVHWNIPSSSPIRIFIFGRRYVPILKTFLLFFFKIGVSEA
jgi:hypothetical protein